jgi:Uma2 family endonuclease
MAIAAPGRHVFDVEEWERLRVLGFFGENQRVELIEGEIVDMSPIGERHAACVNRLTKMLVRQVADDGIVQVQGPVRTSQLSEPLADFAVLKYRADFYSTGKPGPHDVLLLIEVADSTRAFDLGTKALLYARSAIPEYWLFDLGGDVVHVMTSPAPDGYQSSAVATPGTTLLPHLLANVSVEISSALGLS